MKLSDMLQVPKLSPYVSPFQIAPFGFEGEGDGDGGKGDGDGGQGNQGGNSNQGGNGGQAGGQGGKATGTDKDKGSDDDDDDDEYKGLTPAQLKAKLKQESDARKAAAKTAKDLQDEKDKAERGKNDELTNTKKDLETERETTASQRTVIENLGLTNAILNSPDYTWHNVDVVLPLLDRDVVKVDDDGKVEGLKKELKRVATDHPYLLKSSQQGNQGGKGGQQGNGQGRTGIQPGQGGANNGGQQQQVTEADLAKNGYTALIGRR